MPENRPSLAKKHTRDTKQHQDDALDIGVTFYIDDETYSITMGDLSALDARALRQQVGMTFPQILTAILFGGDSADIDHYAAAMWLARRVNGGEENLTFAEVAAGFGYDDLDKIHAGAEAESKRVAAEAKAAKKTVKKIAAVPSDAATA